MEKSPSSKYQCGWNVSIGDLLGCVKNLLSVFSNNPVVTQSVLFVKNANIILPQHLQLSIAESAHCFIKKVMGIII
jgi:hypothetical protein